MRNLQLLFLLFIIALSALYFFPTNSNNISYVPYLKKDVSINEAINDNSFKNVRLQYSDMAYPENTNFWIKIPLKNDKKQAMKKSIIFFWTSAKLDLYYVDKGKILNQSLLHDEDRSGFLTDDFILEPNAEITLYIKLKDTKIRNIFKCIKIVEQKNKNKIISQELTYFHGGLFYGMLLSIFFFNLIVYFSIKEKNLGFYCLILLPALLYIPDSTTLILEWLNFSKKSIIMFFDIFLPSCYFIGFVLFTKYFFETKDNAPWVNRIIDLCLGFAICLLIYNLIFTQYNYVLTLFILPICSIVGFINLKRQFYPALLFIISSAFIYYPFLFYTLPFDIKYLDFFLTNNTFNNDFQVSSTIASILLCFSIYIKLRMLYIEKLSFQQELIAKSRLAAMGEMIANIAHQWRQPLNNVSTTLANIEMLNEMGMLSQKQIKGKVNEAYSQIDYMSDTINDFLNFFSAKKKCTIFNLSDALDSVILLLKTSFRKEKISLHVKTDDSSIDGCKNELIQVLTVILTNAKDALKDKDEKQIWLSVKNKKIIIEDNAGGINTEILEKIFEPYFSTKKEKNGTGLGLYMSKMIVEKKLGGTLSVVNTKEGAKFTIDLSNIK